MPSPILATNQTINMKWYRYWDIITIESIDLYEIFHRASIKAMGKNKLSSPILVLSGAITPEEEEYLDYPVRKINIDMNQIYSFFSYEPSDLITIASLGLIFPKINSNFIYTNIASLHTLSLLKYCKIPDEIPYDNKFVYSLIKTGFDIKSMR